VGAILPPTRLERLLLAGAYVSTAGIGLSVLLDPPILANVLGQTLTVIWACFVLTAAICVPAVLRARYRVEYTLLPILLAALAVSVIALWVHYGNGDISYTLPRELVATALVFMFSFRLASLHRIVHITGTGGRSWIRRRLSSKQLPPSS
jgi:hypothetical protein